MTILNYCNSLFTLCVQEWELFLGQIVSDVKPDANKSKDGLPSWIDQDRVQAVSVLKVSFILILFFYASRPKLG